MPINLQLTPDQIASLQACESGGSQQVTDPRVEALVTELIGRVADKWTMLILEVLTETRRGHASLD